MTDSLDPNSDFSPATWTFKTEVQKLRERLGLSQRAFAALLHYSQAQIAKVENGTSPPSLAFA
ncbi:helix-turn-helix transcriptional regulator, partial [Streptomyces sp. SID11233]|nr:helix-turn-helix transcriptional regulator [Streptomyces sp. SID11233]